MADTEMTDKLRSTKMFLYFAMPEKLAKQDDWARDVAKYAERCGYETAPLMFGKGRWCNEQDGGLEDLIFDPPQQYTKELREVQLRRLEGHGVQCSYLDEDIEAWPQCWWAKDKDRIVLLHEYILEFPADGTFEWEWTVCLLARILWDPMNGSGNGQNLDTDGQDNGLYTWDDYKDEEAPGRALLPKGGGMVTTAGSGQQAWL